MALEVELSPWSQSLTEMDLRPLKWRATLSEAYYAAGHAFLGRAGAVDGRPRRAPAGAQPAKLAR